MEHRLAAILAADVVGYSSLMNADEAGTLSRLESLRKESVERRITQSRKRTVSVMADGLLAEVPSMVDVVHGRWSCIDERARGRLAHGTTHPAVNRRQSG